MLWHLRAGDGISVHLRHDAFVFFGFADDPAFADLAFSDLELRFYEDDDFA